MAHQFFTVAEMLEEEHFKKLASKWTSLEAFNKLVDEHCAGYTQKKRIVDTLKDLSAKLEVVENKIFVAKNVGKAKGKLEPEEQELADTYAADNVKDKTKSLNALMQIMIDDGKLAALEKPVVLENLKQRQAKAKETNKTAVVEKLEKSIKAVCKATATECPVTKLEDIFMEMQHVKEAEKLEKKPIKSLSKEDAERVRNKWRTEEKIEAMKKESRMWFETENEFKPRFSEAAAVLAVDWAEKLRLMEEEAKEKKRLADEAALEAKRVADIERQEKEGLELIKKLEEKRLEAAKLPVKEAPKKAIKPKKAKVQMNPFGLFLTPEEIRRRDHPELFEDEDEDDDTDIAASTPAATPAATPAVTPAIKPAASPQIVPAASPQSVPAASPQSVPAASPQMTPAAPPKVSPEAKVEPKKETKKEPKVKAVLENKWNAPATVIEGEIAEEVEETMASAAKVAEILDGPSLAEATKVAPVKKIPPPQPKKKTKKVMTKLNPFELGFDCDNKNFK